ncbi:MAG: hypothetical protein AAAB35_02000 [Phyllobacterium sp.]|uniref:hypothetical protein n=1 Tax=Phyllobacterium sp. TaxID=1871046 RepID=UPI0030F353F8
MWLPGAFIIRRSCIHPLSLWFAPALVRWRCQKIREHVQQTLLRRCAFRDDPVHGARTKGLATKLEVEVPISMLRAAVNAIDATNHDARRDRDKLIWLVAIIAVDRHPANLHIRKTVYWTFSWQLSMVSIATLARAKCSCRELYYRALCGVYQRKPAPDRKAQISTCRTPLETQVSHSARSWILVGCRCEKPLIAGLAMAHIHIAFD